MTAVNKEENEKKAKEGALKSAESRQTKEMKPVHLDIEMGVLLGLKNT